MVDFVFRNKKQKKIQGFSIIELLKRGHTLYTTTRTLHSALFVLKPSRVRQSRRDLDTL